jgi:hypothetical protein
MLNENGMDTLTETESSCGSPRGSVTIIEEELSHKQFAGKIKILKQINFLII